MAGIINFAVYKFISLYIHCKKWMVILTKLMSSQFHPNSYLARETRKWTLDAEAHCVCMYVIVHA